VRWGWLVQNPASSASPPRVPAPDIHPPSPAQLAKLFAAAGGTDPDLADFILLAAATGARRSELVALRWSDIDLEAGRLTISRAIVAGPDGLVAKDTKTHAARNVSLDATCVGALVAHRERASERARLCGVELSPGAYVFSAEVDGTAPWYPDSASRSFARLCRRTGIAGVRLHDLRHYVATRLLSAGSTCARWPADSVTATPRQRSTSTATSSSRRTGMRPTSSAVSSTTPSSRARRRPDHEGPPRCRNGEPAAAGRA
jgi:integrase